ncbi:MAG: SH3 domain-containing protein, partial [Anaerolineae bacterium]
TTLQVTFSLAEPPVLDDQPQPPSTPQSALSELVSKLSPIASGVVIADGMAARQGPGNQYARAAEIGKGELLGIFGVNANRDWAYIVTISGTLGWVPVDGLRIIGSLEGAPVLPANPIMRQLAQPKATAASQVAVSSLSVAQLAEVTRATVKSDQLNMRQGPGPDYRVLRTLQHGDTLSIRALNKARDWALVVTDEGKPGWVYLEYLDVMGSLESAPVVRSAAPSDVLPADDIAPFSSTATSGATISSPQPTSVPAADTDVSNMASVSRAALPLRLPLVSLATARPARGEATLYRGPRSDYAPVVTLHQGDEAAVLATSLGSRDWLLLLPPHKSPGWAMRNELQVEGSLENAPQVMTAWVQSNEIALREQPGIAYPRTGMLTINTLVIVLGLDKSRGWALVAPLQGSAAGWVGLRFLNPSGSWGDLPELPPDVLLSAPEAGAQARTVEPPSRATGNGRGLLAIQLSSGGDIVLINADGSGLRRLTNGIDPVLSPDGSQVAFTRWTGEDGSVWVINIDGSGERAILGATKQAKHPAWSPDGSRIVVNFQHGGRLEEKEICKNLIEIKMRDKMPNIPWNVDPDSIKVKIRNRIPYLCWMLPPDPYWGLRVINLADGSYQDLPSDNYAFAPEWDPANDWRIVSSGQGGLVQLDINRLKQWALSDRREDRTPAFSPDGRFIAVAYRQNGGYDIYRLNADGSGRVRLTQTPLWITAMPEGGKQWNNVSPAWSPDGSQIAFLT